MPPTIIAAEQHIAPDVQFGENVRIEAEKIVLESGVVIGNDVTIRTRELRLGYKTIIHDRCLIQGIRGAADLIQLGDFCMIGSDGRILIPVLTTGDYNALHNHILINGYKPCRLGHNIFVGQHSVLNATEELTIGNNFFMALNGYVWTHAIAGEVLEGCNFYSRTPTVIEDNVWLAGCNVSISPGVRLANGTIVLSNAVVTKDTLPRHCYGGVPARDLTEQMNPYRDVTLAEKADMMRTFVQEFIEEFGDSYAPCFEFLSTPDAARQNPEAQIVIIEQGAPRSLGDGVSVFSLSDKTYLKQRTTLEEKFIRFLISGRARFLPQQQ
jgi:acetyltransferase-like isoleucine patch superfamily enzyme